ncbi:MAG: TetR/AcrR family transcriptional regulator [Pontibacterium sp.]
MSHKKTAGSIVRAAEELFAENGFAETTVRQITAKADVNLAAVNYHFGSKQGLVLAVAEKCLVPLCHYVETGLNERLSGSEHRVSLEEALEILMRSLLMVNRDNDQALSVFMRLLELAYMRNQEELRDFLIARYGQRFQGLLKIVREDAAPMEDDEFFWRLHFLMGSITFTLSNYQTISALEKREFHRDDAAVEEVLHRMVPVLSAGFQARSDRTYFCRI